MLHPKSASLAFFKNVLLKFIIVESKEVETISANVPAMHKCHTKIAFYAFTSK